MASSAMYLATLSVNFFLVSSDQVLVVRVKMHRQLVGVVLCGHPAWSRYGPPYRDTQDRAATECCPYK